MSGTRFGGIAARETNKRLYGADWYKRIGQKGGKAGHTGGFASNPELAREAGKKGGTKSRRGPQPKVVDPEVLAARKERSRIAAQERRKLVRKLLDEHREKMTAMNVHMTMRRDA